MHEHVFVQPNVIVSRRVLDGTEPVRMLIHHADETWSVLCGTVSHPDDAESRTFTWLTSHPELAPLVPRVASGRMLTRDHPRDLWLDEPDEDD